MGLGLGAVLSLGIRLWLRLRRVLDGSFGPVVVVIQGPTFGHLTSATAFLECMRSFSAFC